METTTKISKEIANDFVRQKVDKDIMQEVKELDYRRNITRAIKLVLIIIIGGPPQRKVRIKVPVAICYELIGDF